MTVTTISDIKNSNVPNPMNSPFAVYENEKIELVPNDEPRGHFTPTELDTVILIMVNKLLVVTSKMLECAIKKIGLSEVEQADVQKRLKHLAAAEFLSKYVFTDGNGNSSYKVYMLSWRGVGFLKKSLNIRPRLGDYLANSDATHIKRILSAGQYIVQQGIDFDDYTMGEVIFVPEKQGAWYKNRVFRSQAIIQREEETVFIESVRRNEMWKEEVENKIRRIFKVMKEKTHNISIKKPSLVLIAESAEHMNEVMEWIGSRFKWEEIPIYYTSDSLVYTQPESCLFDIKKTFWKKIMWKQKWS